MKETNWNKKKGRQSRFWFIACTSPFAADILAQRYGANLTRLIVWKLDTEKYVDARTFEIKKLVATLILCSSFVSFVLWFVTVWDCFDRTLW